MAKALPSELRLLPFVIDDWQFESVHRLPKRQRRETGLILRDRLLELFEHQRPEAALCKPEPYFADRSAQYLRYADAAEAAGRRRPTWAQYLPKHVTGIDDSQFDIETYSLLFAIREHLRSDRIIGAFSIYNVRITSQGVRKVTASGYPAPGLPSKANYERFGEQLSRVIRFFLSAELQLEDRRKLSLDELVFPTEDHEHRWEDAPAVTRVLVDVNRDGHTVERKNAKLRRIRK